MGVKIGRYTERSAMYSKIVASGNSQDSKMLWPWKSERPALSIEPVVRRGVPVNGLSVMLRISGCA